MIGDMAPVKTPNVKALFASIDRLAPNRDRASDGWIGDLAHQDSKSGHNPDRSGNAEYKDGDSKDEVRAGDIDADLRRPGVTMTMVAEKIRTTPALRKRAAYIIWNRRIASANSGWVWRTYTGSNPHTKHLHVSTIPSQDENSAPWRELEELGEAMSLATDERTWLSNLWIWLRKLDGRNALGQVYTRIALGEDHLYNQEGKPYEPIHPSLIDLGNKLDEIRARQDAMVAAMAKADAAEVERDTDLRMAVEAFQRGELNPDEIVDAALRRFSINPSPVQSATSDA